MRLITAAATLSLVGAVLAFATPLAAQAPNASPAAVGVSAAGVATLKAEMRALVDQKKLAGVTTLLARKGQVVHADAYGAIDAAGTRPAALDSIWRIASMTKPVTGVAMMILYEEGRWKLDDPVAKHIPEFAGLKVRTADGALVAQTRPMTMAQLMSHTAGFGTSATYETAQLGSGDLQAMVTKLAALPLASQPGSDWAYGPVVNIQGYVVEKLSGQSLDQFFKSRIFDPLKMPDTGFWVDPAKTNRVAQVMTYDAAGQLIAAPNSNLATARPRFLAGSGGLYSTAPDYLRFAQMLLNGGQLDGARILKPQTVKLMRADVLEKGVLLDLYGPTQPGIGFGMDFAVVKDPALAKTPQGRDSFYWGGAFGTWFWIDPTNDLIFVGMMQNLRGSVPGAGTPDVRAQSARLVYDALTDKR